MVITDIQTLHDYLDLESFDYNLKRMAEAITPFNVSLASAHAKMHKSVNVARSQHDAGKASGICCQKVSEADSICKSRHPLHSGHQSGLRSSKNKTTCKLLAWGADCLSALMTRQISMRFQQRQKSKMTYPLPCRTGMRGGACGVDRCGTSNRTSRCH